MPRQRTISYLGSIREDSCSETAQPLQRLHFWERISARLDSLAVDPAERDQIEASIGARVPRPDPETAAKAEQ